jgi:hypothetical protein
MESKDDDIAACIANYKPHSQKPEWQLFQGKCPAPPPRSREIFHKWDTLFQNRTVAERAKAE